jgi:arylsulfatase A-like enzyme
MSLKSRKDLYLLTPVVLLIIGLAIYLVFQIPERDAGQPNVLFITMDSLRHDHLGCTGYERAHTPNIDSLARDGALFKEALAQATYTRLSVPSIVSGKFTCFIGIRMLRGNLDSSHTTLAEVLHENEYFTFSTTRMWSKSFYQGFEKFAKPTQKTPSRTEQTIQAFEEYKEDKDKFFIWLYYWDPHAPYDPPEEFIRLYEPDHLVIPLEEQKTRGKGRQNRLRDTSGHYNGSTRTLLKLNSGEIQFTSGDRAHLLNLYDAEIAYVDAEIGKIVAKLKTLGLYDSTLIVLSSDHGEGFGEHGKYYHGMTVYDEMARVPIIIKPPRWRNRNKVVLGQVRNIDLMPTILDYCGLRVPEDCVGQSLRPFIEGDACPQLPSITETRIDELNPLMAFRHEGYKLIYNLGNGQVWLYDLGADPGEKQSLLPQAATIEPAPEETQDPARQKEQQLRRELLDLLGLQQLADLDKLGKDLKPIDEETQAKLKALGYVY